MTALLEPAFIKELEALRRRLEIRARSGAAGEHLAKKRGGSAEFQDHRPYSPGDDLRRIDWAAFARTGEPVLKLFRTEEDVIVRLLVDSSASIDFGTPSKLEVARKTAAAIGYMILAGSQRAQLVSVGNSIKSMSKAVRGKGGVPGLLKALDTIVCDGETDLSSSIDAVIQRSARAGLLVVISDFLDPGPLMLALSRAKSAGHDLALVQVLSPQEMHPDYEGDWTLEDAETGATVDITMDPQAIQAYILRLAGLCEELRSFSRKHGATYVRTITTEPLEAVIRRFVARTVD